MARAKCASVMSSIVKIARPPMLSNKKTTQH